MGLGGRVAALLGVAAGRAPRRSLTTASGIRPAMSRGAPRSGAPRHTAFSTRARDSVRRHGATVSRRKRPAPAAESVA